jgi:hypothetical protein
MTIRQNNPSSNYRAFNAEVAKLFQRAMTEARDNGQERGLSRTEICVAIAVAAVHCQALALMAGELALSDFDGLLEKDLTDTRARHAAHQASKTRPLS